MMFAIEPPTIRRNLGGSTAKGDWEAQANQRAGDDIVELLSILIEYQLNTRKLDN